MAKDKLCLARLPRELYLASAVSASTRRSSTTKPGPVADAMNDSSDPPRRQDELAVVPGSVISDGHGVFLDKDTAIAAEAGQASLPVSPSPVSPPSSQSARWPHTAKRLFLLLLDQWLLIGMGVACVLGYFYPDVAKSGGTIRSQYSILYGAVAYIFLISGLSIPREKLIVHLTNWRLHVLVQGMSFVVAPAILTAVLRIIVAADHRRVIDRAVVAGYVLLGCLPTTISSNSVMTRAAGGDEAAVLVEVLVANLIGPFVTPAWTIALLPRSSDFDIWRGHGADLRPMYVHVFKEIGLSVLLPLVVGQSLRWAWPAVVESTLARFYLKKLSTVCLLLITWTTFSSCFATNAFELLEPGCIAFILLFNVALYLLWTAIVFVLARPPWRPWPSSRLGRALFTKVEPLETIAICFCGPAKTTALGIPLLNAMWITVDLLPRSTASIPVLMFTTEQIFVAHFMVYVFRRWLARTPKLDDELGQETALEAS